MTPTTLSKPWHYNSQAFLQIGAALQGQGKAKYHIVEAPSDEVQKIAEWYQHHPVPGLTLKRVEIIHNPQMARLFEGRIALLEERHENPAFKPRWDVESKTASERKQREDVLALLNKKAAPFQDPDHPHVTIIPFWHGTRKEILHSLFKTGFANLATTDSGYFGKGIYSTGEAEYAYRVYSQGALLINWVAVYSVFPVLKDDMKHLTGKGNYQNYDGHFVPVVPKDPNNPHEVSYYPCKPGEKHIYTELVVFESSQVLPRYLVELQPELPASPPGMGQSNVPSPSFNVGDLLTVLLELLDDFQIQEHVTLRPYLDNKVERLLELDEKALLEPEEAKFFKLAKRLLTQGKVNKAVLNLILKNTPAPSSSPSLPVIQSAHIVQPLQEQGTVVPISPTENLFPKHMIAPSPSSGVTKSIPTAQKASTLLNSSLLVSSLIPSSVPLSTPTAPLSIPKISKSITPTLPSIAFGAAKWNQYFGDVGVEPPLPPNIDEILSSPCPFWPGKKVEETHLLTLVPQTINGVPLTITSLGELVRNPKQEGYSAKICSNYFDDSDYFEKFEDLPAPASHWVLMTRDVLEGSRNKDYADQQALVACHAQKSGIPYQVPNILDAAVSILMEHVHSAKVLYSDRPDTKTSCQEKYDSSTRWAIGSFSQKKGRKLIIAPATGRKYNGVGCSLKF